MHNQEPIEIQTTQEPSLWKKIKTSVGKFFSGLFASVLTGAATGATVGFVLDKTIGDALPDRIQPFGNIVRLNTSVLN